MKKRSARRQKDVNSMTVIVFLAIAGFSAVIGYVMGVASIAGKF